MKKGTIVKAILMNKDDNVAMVLSNVQIDDVITFCYENEELGTIRAKENIESYHKVAVQPIQKDTYIYKYGEIIGKATQLIEIGEHVHVENIKGVTMKQ